MQVLTHKIVDKHLDIKKGENIYLAGNAYALDYLDSILKAILLKGAKVTSVFWTDAQLLSLLNYKKPEVAVRMWLPKPINKNTIDTFLHGKVKANKIITLLSSPFSANYRKLLKTVKVTSKEFTATINRFEMIGMKNCIDLVHSPFKLCFLDYPSISKVEQYDYKFDQVVDQYRNAILADSSKINKLNKKVSEFFRNKKKIHITCPRGTDFSFELAHYSWNFEDMNLAKNSMVQIPGGEAFVPPVATSGNGVLVTYPSPHQVVVYFEKGKANKIFKIYKNGKRYRVNHSLVNGRECFCEFGIGTNYKAKPIFTGPIYEKSFGTAHIGIGDNSIFGGSVKSNVHGDFIIEKPTIVADSVLFMKEGVWSV